MRLIDADKLIEKWNELSVRGRTEFDQVIMIMPTAFDVDKVVEQLEELETPCFLGKVTNGQYILRKDAMYIVKRGRIDED